VLIRCHQSGLLPVLLVLPGCLGPVLGGAVLLVLPGAGPVLNLINQSIETAGLLQLISRTCARLLVPGCCCIE